MFYTVDPALTLGIENTYFFNSEINEYLTLPHINWRPVEHFFVQAGVGYYELAHDSQATLMVRVNLLQPSPRKPRRR